MSSSTIRPGSDEEWEALMRQLHRQPKPQPRPFFYARVQAQLADRASAKHAWLPAWVRRPAYVVLLGALVLAVSGDGGTLRSTTTQYNSYQPEKPALLLPH